MRCRESTNVPSIQIIQICNVRKCKKRSMTKLDTHPMSLDVSLPSSQTHRCVPGCFMFHDPRKDPEMSSKKQTQEGATLVGIIIQIYRLCLFATRLHLCTANVIVFFIIRFNKYNHSMLSIVPCTKFFHYWESNLGHLGESPIS